MESIHQAGGARQLGISNCYDLTVLQALYSEARVKPAIVQNRFYKESGYDVALRQWCNTHGIIYQSFWSLTANPHILTSKTMQELTTQYQKTAAQLFFRYLHQLGIVPLTGTKSPQHMQDDLGIFDFELATDDVEKLSAVTK